MKTTGLTSIALAAALASAASSVFSQAFAPPPFAAPPVPEASDFVNPDYLVMKARATYYAARGEPLPSGISTYSTGNVYVTGTIKGDLIVTPKSQLAPSQK